MHTFVQFSTLVKFILLFSFQKSHLEERPECISLFTSRSQGTSTQEEGGPVFYRLVGKYHVSGWILIAARALWRPNDFIFYSWWDKGRFLKKRKYPHNSYPLLNFIWHICSRLLLKTLMQKEKSKDGFKVSSAHLLYVGKGPGLKISSFSDFPFAAA